MFKIIQNTIILWFACFPLLGQEILPPVAAWNGKSESLVADTKNKWITPAEQSGFVITPSYDETMRWLSDLDASTDVIKIVSIGKTAQHRDISMVIVSADKKFGTETLRSSEKPTLLIQAGIHAGEIDGKDAGMMLLRDIIHGGKKSLIEKVNILFVPILNADGHERTSPYNRVNQRGPANMGWRTNSKNLNLNRDYTKLDTEEIKSIVTVINDYKPSLYLDLHVTDGADYQYDITYGYSRAFSPNAAKWLDSELAPYVDNALKKYGHIPGPLMFAVNDKDFSEGNLEFAFAPRFSNNYGDLRHLPSILVENHSLKPFKQRVLGTYVFLEAVLKVLANHGEKLKEAIHQDENRRTEDVVLSWKKNDKIDSMTLEGIVSVREKSRITNSHYVKWTGKPVVEKIAFIKFGTPEFVQKRPKGYWVPSTYKEVITRLQQHGVKLDIITERKDVDLKMYRVKNYTFSPQPFEGHFSVSADWVVEKRKETYYPGSAWVPTDQPLGDLIVHLLEPASSDSFFQWGFFPEIFSRTEYIEEYVIEPLAQQMLKDEKIRSEFEAKKNEDPGFIDRPSDVYDWFYSRSPYTDRRWLLYPVGVVE